MKRVKYISMVATAIAMTAMVSGSAFAMINSDIASTKHNLSSTGAGNQTTGTTEICVFCHTPHGANITQVVPLWNRTMSDPTLFSTYDALGSSTLDGSIAVVGSVSLACLSCHDGQIAMDSLLNAPGSGNPSTDAWTFTSPGGTMNADGLLTSGIALLGTDLRDDHPVGILYAAGNVVGNETVPANFVDPDFKPVQTTTINGAPYWYVETTTDLSDGRDRADMILYTRTDVDQAGGGTIAGSQPYVECASCHDPHVVAADANQVSFLRISNAGSALCLACHVK